jgi:taurine dioxygenase
MAANDAHTIKIIPLTPAIGAEVVGTDLSAPLSDGAVDVIHQAFLDHQVLLFRGQSITPAQQITFTEHFGTVMPHPLGARANHPDDDKVLILENKAGTRGARNDFWHSDISYSERPPSASFLHGVIIPEGKGDTIFCSMSRAWEGLSDGMKDQLAGMTASHSAEALRQRDLATASDGNTAAGVPAPVTHPVIRRHPETGRQSLYVSKAYTTHFTDMSEDESSVLLDLLEARACIPENIYRHRWQVGDALMWDNRCVMHYAVYDYDADEPRRVQRTTAAGDRPAA